METTVQPMTNKHLPQAPTPNIRVLAMRYSDPETWQYMPEVLQRIEMFCTTLDTDSDPEKMSQTARYNYVVENPLSLCLAAIHGGQVVGHLMAEFASWGGKEIVQVIQYELDHGIRHDAIANGWSLIEEWAWQHNPDIEIFQVLAQERGTIEVFRRYGFESKYVVMRRGWGDIK